MDIEMVAHAVDLEPVSLRSREILPNCREHAPIYCRLPFDFKRRELFLPSDSSREKYEVCREEQGRI
jgi:hypothetical protein